MSETSASIKPSALRAPLALLGDGIIGRFTKIEDGIIGKFWGKIMMVAKILAMLLLISPAAADYVENAV